MTMKCQSEADASDTTSSSDNKIINISIRSRLVVKTHMFKTKTKTKTLSSRTIGVFTIGPLGSCPPLNYKKSRIQPKCIHILRPFFEIICANV